MDRQARQAVARSLLAILLVACSGAAQAQTPLKLATLVPEGSVWDKNLKQMAEEWKQENPAARNDRRARELRKILCSNIHGVDINSTACRITAFSLYLAYLDQLTPRDIQELQQNGHKLPTLVHYSENSTRREIEGFRRRHRRLGRLL